MYDFLYYQVRDVMVIALVTVTSETTIGRAEAIFEEHDFNGLPVVDKTGRLAGLVTKLDVLRAFAFRSQSKVPEYEAIMGRQVWEIMTREPRTVDPFTPLTRVIGTMVETGFKSLPVVEGGRLEGMVAREDVLRALRLAAQGQGPDRVREAGFPGRS
ncbi:MAG: CBS domain-containing protein [Thermodesulfobacteriota bacterium]